jgi:hypothetical protein
MRDRKKVMREIKKTLRCFQQPSLNGNHKQNQSKWYTIVKKKQSISMYYQL